MLGPGERSEQLDALVRDFLPDNTSFRSLKCAPICTAYI